MTCIGLVIQILYIKGAQRSSLPSGRTYSLHYNANTHFTLHTFLLYLLYVPARPILVITIHVNKAFQLFNLVLFVSSGTNKVKDNEVEPPLSGKY